VDFVVDLLFGGSTLRLSIYNPDGILYAEKQSSTSPITINVTNGKPGLWKYKVTAVDVPYENYPFNIVVKSKNPPPPTGAIVINDGARFTNSTDVILTLRSEFASEMQFSNDSLSWSEWEDYNDFKLWNLTSGDEEKTVYVKFKDENGYISRVYSDTIILDTTGPTGSIVINDGNTHTNSQEVILTLDCDDATQMQFSNDNLSWSEWESYTNTRSWTLLLGDGEKTVYVRFKDAAGNISETFLDTIVLDTLSPAAKITSPATGETISGTVDIEGLAQDENFKDFILEYGEGASPLTWTIITTETTPVSNDTLTTWDTQGVPDGDYTLKLTVEDLAGNISQDTVFVRVNNLPPSITHDPISSATYNEPVLITAEISSEVSISSATVHFRKGGDATYSSITMQSGSSYGTTIPSTHVTERGLEYYIKAEDINGNVATSPEENASLSPYTVRVNFSSLSFPFTTQTKKWQMISVPVELTNSDPDSVLVDDLGTQDNTKWKLYRWNTQNAEYDSYPNIPDSFTPGKAFWLITKDAKQIDVEEGTNVDTSGDYSINLASGWTQIGCPFAFSIDWNDVKVRRNGETVSIQQAEANGWIRDTIWYWNGNEYTYYQAPDGVLEPWKGYWVKALESCTLLIPPLESGETKLLSTSSKSGEKYLQIIAKVGELKDSYNFIGLSDNAKDSYDKEDIEEAPPISPYISLSFPHSDWGKDSGSYTQDIREARIKSKSYPEKITWDMQVKTDQLNKVVTLEWKNTDAIPKEYNLYLTDEDENVLSCMREKNNYSFTTSTEKTLFKVIATTKSLSSPKDLTLTKVYSYPNPANNTTNIHFKLGADANVTIRIYTISGELVKTLVENKFYSAGTNTELWQLNNNRGEKVARGIYILLVKATNSSKTLMKIDKIAVIK